MTLSIIRICAIAALSLGLCSLDAGAQTFLPEGNPGLSHGVAGGSGGGVVGSLSGSLTSSSLAISSAIHPASGASINFGKSAPEFSLTEEKLGNHQYHVGKEVINAPASVIFAHITDYGEAGRLFANLKNCKVLSEDRGTKIVHFSLRGVANIFNLDYTLAIKEVAPSGGGTGFVEWHRLAGAFKANDGYWKLEPIEGNKTLVTYTKYIDGGLIPQALVNRELDQTIPQIMANLKRISEAG